MAIEISIRTPEEILNTPHSAIQNHSNTVIRDGIELEKGVVLSNQRIEKNIDLIKKYCWFWSIYPDRYIDFITPVGSKFQLKFFQRIFLRACLRHGRIVTIAPRAAGKTFITILALILISMFRPHSRTFTCAPGKAQGAKLSSQKIKQLFDLFPILKWEVEKENYGADYVTIGFKNGSEFTIMSPLNSTRGQRATFGSIEEYRFSIISI